MADDPERIAVFLQTFKDLSTGSSYQGLVTDEGYVIGRQIGVHDRRGGIVPTATVEFYIDGWKPGLIEIGAAPDKTGHNASLASEFLNPKKDGSNA